MAKKLSLNNMQGMMFENPVPKGKKWPHYKGSIRIGKVTYQVVAWRGWTKTDKKEYVSLRLEKVKDE